MPQSHVLQVVSQPAEAKSSTAGIQAALDNVMGISVRERQLADKQSYSDEPLTAEEQIVLDQLQAAREAKRRNEDTMRVAVYARVSTEDRGRDPENQLRDLRAWCANSGHDIVGESIDHVSGRKSTGERKRFAALPDDATRRKFDCVLFWALDRFSREGMVRTIQHLERLNSYGVTFHSYTEPHLRADNEMVGGILQAALATMAKQEAKRLSACVIAGMRKAAAKGTKSGKSIGRPRVSAEKERAIQRLLRAGPGINKMAATVGVGTATVQRFRAEMRSFESGAAA